MVGICKQLMINAELNSQWFQNLNGMHFLQRM
jgi:hypothetical protein